MLEFHEPGPCSGDGVGNYFGFRYQGERLESKTTQGADLRVREGQKTERNPRRREGARKRTQLKEHEPDTEVEAEVGGSLRWSSSSQ